MGPMRTAAGIPMIAAWLMTAFPPSGLQTAAAAILEVPSGHSTIQAAIGAALDRDTVLVAPGVYRENLRLSGKTITLASRFLTTGNRAFIDQTILDGRGGSWVINVESSVGPATTIAGFTIRNAADGVTATGKFNFLDNRVTATGDGIDYEDGSGGWVRSCLFEDNTDDGIDLDNDVAVVIEQSTIRNNRDDGIEIRLQSYVGPTLEIVIRDNVISGNGEDGIQLIGYDVLTSRVFRIERNLFAGNAMAAIGMMCCANTNEDFQGASLRERVYLVHNTFVGNDHGVTGGDSLIALNNIFTGTTRIAMKRVDGGSIAAYNLFFANGTDYSQSNVDLTTTLGVDPLLRPDHRLRYSSPAIDAGTAFYSRNGVVVLDVPPGEYSGSAPDLGAFEFDAAAVPAVPKEGIALLAILLAGPALGSAALRAARRARSTAVAER